MVKFLQKFRRGSKRKTGPLAPPAGPNDTTEAPSTPRAEKRNALFAKLTPLSAAKGDCNRVASSSPVHGSDGLPTPISSGSDVTASPASWLRPIPMLIKSLELADLALGGFPIPGAKLVISGILTIIKGVQVSGDSQFHFKLCRFYPSIAIDR